jgi:hypothetical protein
MRENGAISALLLGEKITKTVRQRRFGDKIKNSYN